MAGVGWDGTWTGQGQGRGQDGVKRRERLNESRKRKKERGGGWGALGQRPRTVPSMCPFPSVPSYVSSHIVSPTCPPHASPPVLSLPCCPLPRCPLHCLPHTVHTVPSHTIHPQCPMLSAPCCPLPCCPLPCCPLPHCPLSHCPFSHCPPHAIPSHTVPPTLSLPRCPLPRCPLPSCPSRAVLMKQQRAGGPGQQVRGQVWGGKSSVCSWVTGEVGGPEGARQLGGKAGEAERGGGRGAGLRGGDALSAPRCPAPAADPLGCSPRSDATRVSLRPPPVTAPSPPQRPRGRRPLWVPPTQSAAVPHWPRAPICVDKEAEACARFEAVWTGSRGLRG